MTELTAIYGTEEPLAPVRKIVVGPLSFLQTPDALRQISWDGTELVRAICWPIRDLDWGTYPPENFQVAIEEGESAVSARITFAVHNGALTCALVITGTAKGRLDVAMTMTPHGGPFQTNRAGLTLLHPIDGVAGAPLTVTHSDGGTEDTTFPRLISPGQPVFDIQGFRYGVAGKTVDITFGGEVFEMEDQRNWSDASYKTYCVPLVFPFAYSIDDAITQTVRLDMSGGGSGAAAKGAAPVSIEQGDGTAPDIGLVVEPGWLSDAVAIRHSGAGFLRARFRPGDDAGYLSELAASLSDLPLEAEIVLPDTDPATHAANVAAALAQANLTPARVIALPESYLASHQPSGPWPEGATPAEAAEAARAAFPKAQIGGGMLTNFTEFNRHRPNAALYDFVTHGNTAIVHAGDDLSVRETLEALPQIFESAKAIAGDTPYRLGLVSIGMRSNPYGSDVAGNPDGIRRTMARNDPRHRGLFGAAWAVGVLAGTAGRGVESLCLAAPAGPFGLSDDAGLFPLFHVVRKAAALSGQGRTVFTNLPAGVFAYGTSGGAMIANVTPEAQSVILAAPARVAVLDTGSFAEAASDPHWLDQTAYTETTKLHLEGFATAFIRT